MNLKDKINEIRLRFLSGEIDREKAKNILIPYINDYNKKGKEIAKKHNKKFIPLSFTGILR